MKYFLSFLLMIAMCQAQAQKAYIDDLLDIYTHKTDFTYTIKLGKSLGFDQYDFSKNFLEVFHVKSKFSEGIILDTRGKDSAKVYYHTQNQEIYDEWITWLQDHQFKLVKTREDIISLVYHRYYFYESSTYTALIDLDDDNSGRIYSITIQELPKKG